MVRAERSSEDLIIGLPAHPEKAGERGIESHIGAVAYSPSISIVAHDYLGKTDSTNVYAAELTAIHLGIKMAGTSSEHHNECYIYADSQPSIQAIDKPKQQSGQYIIRNILNSLDELQNERPGLVFRIEWVLGHMGIKGNEKADEEAKNAALGGLRKGQTLSHHKLKSTQIAKINNDTKAMVKEEWNTGKGNARQLRKLTQP